MNPKSPVSEGYHMLRVKIEHAASVDGIRTLLVTSALMGEGKSMTAANLSAAFALAGKKVLILDADLRKPTVHQIFMKSNRFGLSDVLGKKYPIEDAIHETDIPGLFAVTSGTIPASPTELLSSKRMTCLLEELKTRFDLILIDSPPAIAPADAQILAGKSDGVLLVIRCGKVKRKVIRQALSGFEYVNARIVGAVLNNIARNDKNYYYDMKWFG